MLSVPYTTSGRIYSAVKDCEKVFGSPSISNSNSDSAQSPPIEPSAFSLDEVNSSRQCIGASVNSHVISPRTDNTEVKEDTRGAALLLTSMKLLVHKEIGRERSTNGLLTVPLLKPNILDSAQSKIGSRFGFAFEKAFRTEKLDGDITKTRTSRARTVSVDSPFSSSLYEAECSGSSFQTDALPSEKICLDLTSDSQNTKGTIKDRPVEISPPSSPKLQSYNPFLQKGPQGLRKRKSLLDMLPAGAEAGHKKQKKKEISRPSTLSVREVQQNKATSTTSVASEKKILRKKFSWKNYPELEQFLIANREEYLRHSAMNYTMQQKEYNNRLTERLIELANECCYVFDEESFSFVSVRDRIRCYFKSYVQSRKKRGVIIGYAAKKAGLLTEEQLEKSAAVKGKIVVPKKASKRSLKVKASD
mmetsp:Transcript_3959/g.5164  ORF Transcript_3959/g.5164 Transcript_3959/m.5164 type:complete len:418 (+) Transcript_3959:153-1406(+)